MSTAVIQSASAQAENFLPGPVLLLGAPGVGKGTQAQLLMGAFAIPQISTGDLLRDHRIIHSMLGQLAESYMKQGQLVPDDLVNEMVADRLTQPDTQDGYILDGYPRTLPQASWLDEHLASTKSRPLVALSIIVGSEELLHRVTGRRTCPVCRTIYNTWSNPPTVDNVCDLDGALLVQRIDDSEEVFRERMKTFDAQTAPVVEHYRVLGRFQEIDGDYPMQEVAAVIRVSLRQLRGVA